MNEHLSNFHIYYDVFMARKIEHLNNITKILNRSVIGFDDHYVQDAAH